jgi:hypothetical protein
MLIRLPTRNSPPSLLARVGSSANRRLSQRRAAGAAVRAERALQASRERDDLRQRDSKTLLMSHKPF